QEHDGTLNFVTNVWTSLNHKAYVVVTVHFENDGVVVSMLLNLVQVAINHSSVNLAAVFTNILGDFGISDKVQYHWQL
ncbi:hypothetical protein L208DRAFT_1270295, partial [Tricholoma matsutake]